MTTIQRPLLRRFAFRRLFFFASLAGQSTLVTLFGAQTAKYSFDLPVDVLEKSVKRFAAQSGSEVLIPGDALAEIRTRAVRGEMTSRQALEAMLAGTGLTVLQDQKTGAFAVRKEAPGSNDPRPPNPTATDRPIDKKKRDVADDTPKIMNSKTRHAWLGSLFALFTASDPLLAQSAAPPAGVASANGGRADTILQKGSISGRVLNANSGNYLNNARIAVEGTNVETFSDENGEYRLSGVPARDVRVTASFTGLTPQSVAVRILPGDVSRKDFELTIAGAPAGGEGGIVTLEAFTVRERMLTGQAIALHERRSAPNIKNVIAIDVDTGEGNVGEFLKYIPGIGIEQGFQNPQFASIRGMPASGTLVTINGMGTATNSFASGRETDLGLAPTGNIDRIEVTKVPTPDLPANAVGGGINLISKSGFNRKHPLFSYNVYGTLNTLDGLRGPGPIFGKSDGPDQRSNVQRINPSVNLSYLLPVNRSVALAFSLSKSNRYSDWDVRRPIWDRVNLRLISNSMNTLPVGEAKLLAATTLDWKMNDQHVLSMNFSHSNQEIFVRQNTVTWTFGANAVGGPTFVQGAATGVGSVGLAHTGNDQSKTLNLCSISHRYNGSIWRIDGHAAYSWTRIKVSDLEDGFFGTANLSMANLVLRNDRIDAVDSRKAPLVTAVNRTGAAVGIHDATNYSLPAASSSAYENNNTGRSVAINIGRSLDLPFAFSIKAGAVINRVRNNAVAGVKTWAFNPPGGTDGRLIGNHDLIADAFSARRRFTDANNNEVQVRWLSLGKLKALYDAHPEWFALNESGAYINAVNAVKTIEETISAGYFRSDLKLFDNRWWIVSGVRFEHTADEGWGPLNDFRNLYRQDASGNLIRDAGGRPIRITTDALESARLQYRLKGTHAQRSYEGFYPSINTSFWFGRNVVARAAYARTIGRPNYTEIIPGYAASDPEAPVRTVTVVNTALKPWTSDNYDLSLEVYEARGAVASVSLFRKNVRDFFASNRTPATPQSLADLGLPEEYVDYDIVTKRNAGEASITGIEGSYRQSFNFLPAWGRGLQVFLNVTSMALSGANQNDFTNFNSRIVQQGVSYVRKKFNAKISWNQTKWRRRGAATASATVRPNSQSMFAPMTKIDISVDYMLSKRYTLYGDVRNLSATPQRSGVWSPDTPVYARVDTLQFPGASFTFGIKGDF